MQIRQPEAGDRAALLAFLQAEGRGRRVPDLATLERLLAGADRALIAVDDGRIVGFGRALCDGVSNGYLSLLQVAGDRRREGIGTALVAALTGDDSGITWVLRASDESRPFWRALGFGDSTQAMERPRA